jgi:hypothetical protein
MYRTFYIALHCIFSMLLILSMSPIHKKKKCLYLNSYYLETTLYSFEYYHNLYEFAFSLFLDFIFALSQYTTTIVLKYLNLKWKYSNVYILLHDLSVGLLSVQYSMRKTIWLITNFWFLPTIPVIFLSNNSPQIDPNF